jgi:hypothetical protein
MEPARPRAATDFVQRSTLRTARGRAGSNIAASKSTRENQMNSPELAVSMVRWPKQINQFHPAQNRGESAKHADQNVPRRDMDQTAPQQKQSFVAKSRKRREATEQTGKQKQAHGWRKEIVVFGQRSNHTNDKATEHVDAQSAQRELPRLGVVQNEAAEFVASDGTDRTAESNDKNLFYSEHQTSCFVTGVISSLRGFSFSEERQTPLPSRRVPDSTCPATLLPILF